MPFTNFTPSLSHFVPTKRLRKAAGLLSLLLATLSFSTGVRAQQQYDNGVPAAVVVSAPANQTVGPGSNFNVAITTTDTTGLSIISYDTKITFDPTVLQLQATPASVAGTISDGGTMTLNPVAPGQLIVSFFRAAFLSGAGTLFNLHFTAIGTAGQTSAITFTPSPVSGVLPFMYNEGVPAAVPVNGLVRIGTTTAAPSSVSGQVFDAEGRAVAYARVTFTGQDGSTRTGLTNPFGYYTVQEVPTGDVYMVSVRAKGLTFSPRTLFVGDEVTGFDLTADK